MLKNHANGKFDDEFLNKTIKVWQKHYTYPLTLEDAREISENMSGLFRLLDDLDKKYSEGKDENRL